MTISQTIRTIGQIFAQSFPPTSKFSAEDIPDLTGRVCIVTGGYTGIGKETVKALLKKNATVYIAGRSKSKAESAVEELRTSTGKKPVFLELDLANLASIRRSAEEFLGKEQELHILFNNAGVLSCPIEQTTADGYDLQFGTNVLGHWYFTELLMPALLRGKETSPDKHARVITTSSIASYFSIIQWNTLKDGPARRKMLSGQLYAQSKFGNVVVAREVARRYGDQGIISISVNPGNIKTELYRHVWKIQHIILDFITLQPTPLGALTQLYAGTMPEALQHNGEFFIPWARFGKARAEAYDVELGKKLWEWLEGTVKGFK
ncbi:NAD(P)-binding protein [Irpex rosettiformis]|uniref:NAD(P)-binding protein n=1 Tax=Irpex rosettiformis TaxID=378272 RepID=A0ACB8U3G4_9APHY|nr:NAD(P)-binding protein [Irpex rosettiformis]